MKIWQIRISLPGDFSDRLYRNDQPVHGTRLSNTQCMTSKYCLGLLKGFTQSTHIMKVRQVRIAISGNFSDRVYCVDQTVHCTCVSST